MDHRSHVRSESEAFLEAALDGGMDVAVPSCPGWTMTDLVGHLGVVQRFHGGHLRRGVTDPPPGPRPTPPETGLAEWFREGLEELMSTLAHVGTATPAWNFLDVQPATSGFWHRRMAHEAAVHRWDAQMARGRGLPIDQDLAVDGIGEVLESWVPGRRGSTDPAGTVTVRLTDVPVERSLDLGAAAPTVTVSGAASDVLLALWGRIPLSDLDVTGDMDLARSVTVG